MRAVASAPSWSRLIFVVILCLMTFSYQPASAEDEDDSSYDSDDSDEPARSQIDINYENVLNSSVSEKTIKKKIEIILGKVSTTVEVHQKLKELYKRLDVHYSIGQGRSDKGGRRAVHRFLLPFLLMPCKCPACPPNETPIKCPKRSTDDRKKCIDPPICSHPCRLVKSLKPAQRPPSGSDNKPDSDSDSKPRPKPKPGADPDLDYSPEPGPKPDSGPKPKPKPGSDADPGSSPDQGPKPDSGSKPKPKPDANPDSDSSPDQGPKPDSGSKPKPKPDANPDSDSSPDPGPKPDSGSKPKPKPGADFDLDSSPDQGPKPDSGSKPEPGPEPGPDPDSGSSPGSGSKPVPGSRPSPGPKPGSETKSSPKPASGTKSSPKPGPETKSSPRPGSETKSSPKPGSGTKSSPKPGSEPKSSPKPGSGTKSSPKPGSEPKSSPKPGSEIKSSPKPGTESKSSPKPDSAPKSSPKPGTGSSLRPPPDTKPSPGSKLPRNPESKSTPRSKPKSSKKPATKQDLDCNKSKDCTECPDDYILRPGDICKRCGTVKNDIRINGTCVNCNGTLVADSIINGQIVNADYCDMGKNIGEDGETRRRRWVHRPRAGSEQKSDSPSDGVKKFNKILKRSIRDVEERKKFEEVFEKIPKEIPSIRDDVVDVLNHFEGPDKTEQFKKMPMPDAVKSIIADVVTSSKRRGVQRILIPCRCGTCPVSDPLTTCEGICVDNPDCPVYACKKMDIDR